MDLLYQLYKYNHFSCIDQKDILYRHKKPAKCLVPDSVLTMDEMKGDHLDSMMVVMMVVMMVLLMALMMAF